MKKAVLLLVVLLLIFPCIAYAKPNQNEDMFMFLVEQTQTLDHQQLVIRADAWTPNVEESYRQRYPDIDLNLIYDSITAEEVTQMLITQDDSIDVFEVCADYSFSALVKKGFAGDLSESGIIQNEVASMEPAVAAALRDEQGRIIAYPAEFRFWSCGIHEGYWRLVFGDRPLPTNMDELMDAWIDWESNCADEYPDMEFVIGFDYAQYCQKIITFFMQQNDTPDGQPDLNAPILRNILSKLQQVNEIRTQSGRSTTDTSAVGVEGIASIIRFRAWDEAMNEPSKLVVLTSENRLYDMYLWDYKKVPLTFAADDATKTDGTLFVYLVNPYTKNMDAAIKYIECVTELKNEPYIYYAIHPDCNEPYEWPNFQRWIEDSVQKKAELEETKEKIDGMELAKLADIQAMIDYHDRYLKNQENERWMISAQTIVNQRKLLESLDLHTESVYLGAPGSVAEQMIAELCVRYTEGTMTLDAFLDALSGKMRIMQLENN